MLGRLRCIANLANFLETSRVTIVEPMMSRPNCKHGRCVIAAKLRTFDRRTFLRAGGAAGAFILAGSAGDLSGAAPERKADATLRIAPLALELAPGVVVKTTAYNGMVPGPLLRLREGAPFSIDVINDSGMAELTHWHGLATDPINDGAMEQGSPMNPAKGGRIRYEIQGNPVGTRWYHTHTSAGMDVNAAGYTGQFGFLLVDPKNDPGRHDVEVCLAVHHWEGTLTQGIGPRVGQQVEYKYACFNGGLHSASEPIRVRQGERVLFRLLNASATDDVTLALAGHLFQVTALDGNRLSKPKTVSTIHLGVAERVDAIVEMTNPGVWVLGAVEDSVRAQGLGVTVEYAASKGPAVWTPPAKQDWSYLSFSDDTVKSYTPAKSFPMFFSVVRGEGGEMDRWTVNGKSFPNTPTLQVEKGKRYRMVMMNASGEAHPMHLHRHTFEVTSVGGQPMSGLKKDTVHIEPWKKVEIDFVADNPGKSLFHCHQQLHMDCGFMQLIEYV